MLIIKLKKGESIDRALKRLKNKVRKTKQLNNIKENRYYIKKSHKKRDALIKAKYKQSLQD